MSFRPVHIPEHLYFVTATLVGWQHLFVQPVYADMVLSSLKWLREREQCFLYAFVLMPSHLHGLLKPQAEHTIATILQAFGSFTAHRILKQLRQDKREEVLLLMREKQKNPQKTHKVWEGIQAKNVYTPDFLVQKLEYIHNNPINKGWELVGERADYPYSSACFYDRGEPAVIDIDDVRHLL